MYKRDELDRFYTPDALATACIEALAAEEGPITRAFEPSVGGGAFVKALAAAGCKRRGGCDVDPDADGFNYLSQHKHTGRPGFVCDFLELTPEHIAASMGGSCTGVIGNPPYRDAEAHLRHALDVSDRHVAFLLRSSFLASQKRSRDLWAWAPLRKVWVISPRPSFTGDGRTDGSEYSLIWLDKLHHTPATLGWLSEWR